MKKATAYVYIIFRPDGSPCYAGKGKGQRWTSDKERAKHNPHFAAIWKKAQKEGKELPRIKIREGLTDAEAFEIEIALIKAIGRQKDGGPLTNMTDGGDGLVDPSPETRAKMAESARKNLTDEKIERIRRVGKSGIGGAAGKGKKRGPHSPERKAAIGAGNRGKIISESSRAAMSAAKTGKKQRPRSPEGCQAISKAVTEYWQRWRDDPTVRASRTDRNGSYPESRKQAVSAGLLASHEKRKKEGRSVINTRTTIVTIDGKGMNLMDACRTLNLKYDTVRKRIGSGVDLYAALEMI
jgi:hypothetical protein